ncbi:MAG: DUF2846 domain-containing protein [Alphaproteobacteria bacterium]
MAMELDNVARRLRLGGAVLLLALTSMGLAAWGPALAAVTAAPGVAPVSPGTARIWIYRDYEPYETLARPYVRLNGAIIGISEPGAVFYRDVAPGTYTVTVDSEGIDVQQFVSVPVAAGQQAYVKVLASASWDSGSGGGDRGGGGGWARDTFYTWQIQPEAAAAEIAHMPVYAGG